MANFCSFDLYFKNHAPCGIYCKKCPGVKAYNCKGCREQKGQVKNFPTCKTYECVTKRRHNFCHECEDFPCEKLQPIVNFEIFLPHNSKVYNLLMLKKHGIVEWNKICEEKTNLYYNGRKIKYGGDNLTLEEKKLTCMRKRKNK